MGSSNKKGKGMQAMHKMYVVSNLIPISDYLESKSSL